MSVKNNLFKHSLIFLWNSWVSSLMCDIISKYRTYALFGLAYFRAYVKQLVNINMPLCIIYMLVNVIYEKTVYECIIFVNENL